MSRFKLDDDNFYIIMNQFNNEIWGMYHTKEAAEFQQKIFNNTLPYNFIIKHFEEGRK